jgi:hypothetical protein
MSVFKSCLMMLGLVALFVVGSCTFGVFSLSSAVRSATNPRDVHVEIARPLAQTRKAFRGFLEGPSYERLSGKVEVLDYTDGSTHFTYGNPQRPDLSIIATFTAIDDNRTSAVVKFDGDRMASKLPGAVSQMIVQTELKERIGDALESIAARGSADTNLSLTDVTKEAIERAN